jgi:hypothetical protein
MVVAMSATAAPVRDRLFGDRPRPKRTMSVVSKPGRATMQVVRLSLLGTPTCTKAAKGVSGPAPRPDPPGRRLTSAKRRMGVRLLRRMLHCSLALPVRR